MSTSTCCRPYPNGVKRSPYNTCCYHEDQNTRINQGFMRYGDKAYENSGKHLPLRECYGRGEGVINKRNSTYDQKAWNAANTQQAQRRAWYVDAMGDRAFATPGWMTLGGGPKIYPVNSNNVDSDNIANLRRDTTVPRRYI